MTVLVELLKERGYLDNIHLRICNIGSRKLSSADDYGSQAWHAFAPNLTIYGFDADVDACEAANADLEARHVSWQEYHWPYALSDRTGTQMLYVTKHPMCSSLYTPNESLLERFQGLSELAGLDFTVELETITLDDLYSSGEIEGIDFLQIDIQGAELDVFKGANQTLSEQILCIQTEVEFAPIYLNQPLFADVDTYLRERYFSLFDLSQSKQIRSVSPLQGHRPGQILWGDAFYLRDLVALESPSQLATPANLLKLACIAEIMGFVDYALEVLVTLTIRYGDRDEYNVADVIVDTLAQFPDLVEKGLETLPIIQKIQDYVKSSQHLLKPA